MYEKWSQKIIVASNILVTLIYVNIFYDDHKIKKASKIIIY